MHTQKELNMAAKQCNDVYIKTCESSTVDFHLKLTPFALTFKDTTVAGKGILMNKWLGN